MNLELEVNNKNDYSKWLIILFKCILYAVCVGILTTLVHMIISKYILHIPGKPSFFSNSLIIYSACSKVLVAIGYIMLGCKIPIKNPILKSMTYIGFDWASNYLPQVMGLALADGPIAEQAFVISDIIADSIVSLFAGIVLGLLFMKQSYEHDDDFDKRIYVKPLVISAVSFPLLVMILDQLMTLICPAFSSLTAMKISEQVKVPFYINFYSWFILSGALISVLYQITDYNDKDKRSWFKFALKYSLLLWTPVVMIMILFGTEFIATTVFAVLFIISITMLCWINSKVIEYTSVS